VAHFHCRLSSSFSSGSAFLSFSMTPKFFILHRDSQVVMFAYQKPRIQDYDDLGDRLELGRVSDISSCVNVMPPLVPAS